MSFWTVENGEIVGTNGDQRVPGNQFLWYEKKVKNFHLDLGSRSDLFCGNSYIDAVIYKVFGNYGISTND